MEVIKGGNNWNCCPPEIYSKIFRKLEARDIISCLFVNRSWRRIIENDVRMDWQKIAEESLCDGGAEMKTKFNLDWRGVVIKSGEWMHGMQFVKLKNLRAYIGQGDYLPSMTVYKDKLYVCSEKHAEWINIKKCKNTPLENTDMNIVDESDHIRVYSDGGSKLRLVGKKSVDDEGPPTPEFLIGFEPDRHMLYLLEQNRCYIFGKKQCLWSYTWGSQEWQTKFIARFYCSSEFVTMATRGNRVYFMAKHGDLWMTSEDDRAFKKLASFAMPDFYHPANSYTVLKTILSVSSKDNYTVSEEIGGLFLKGVTCATFHAGVLLLAFSNGQVEAFVMKTEKSSNLDFWDRHERFGAGTSSSTEEDKNSKCLLIQSLRFGRSYKSYLQYRRYDLCRLYDFVYGIAVYEDANSRHLFINCGHTIYQYLLTYPSFS